MNDFLVTVTPDHSWNGKVPYVTGGPLKNEIYELKQYHFHWGPRGVEGSEQ